MWYRIAKQGSLWSLISPTFEQDVAEAINLSTLSGVIDLDLFQKNFRNIPNNNLSDYEFRYVPKSELGEGSGAHCDRVKKEILIDENAINNAYQWAAIYGKENVDPSSLNFDSGVAKTLTDQIIEQKVRERALDQARNEQREDRHAQRLETFNRCLRMTSGVAFNAGTVDLTDGRVHERVLEQTRNREQNELEAIQRRKQLFENRHNRYLAVGAWNTVAGLGIFAGFYFLLHHWWHYLAIAALSHFLSVCNAWLGFRIFVFRSRAARLPEFIRFNLSYLFVFVFQLAGMWVMVDYAGFHPIFSQVVLLILAVLLSYVMHSVFSFRQAVFNDGQE